MCIVRCADRIERRFSSRHRSNDKLTSTTQLFYILFVFICFLEDNLRRLWLPVAGITRDADASHPIAFARLGDVRRWKRFHENELASAEEQRRSQNIHIKNLEY